MTVKGTKKKSIDIPVTMLEVINLARIKESTQKVIFNEREIILKMLKESATFRRYQKQIK